MSTESPMRSSEATRAVTKQDRVAARLARLTIAGVAVYVLLDVVAQALPPHYSPVSQAESDLAIGPYGWIMTLNFVVRGLLSVAIFAALWQIMPPFPRPWLGFFLAGVWTIGAFLLAAFPTDVGGSERTIHGTVHLGVALLAFVSIPLAEWVLSRSLRQRPRWGSLGTRLLALANLTALGFILLLVGARAPAIAGLTERTFLAGALLWMFAAALGIRDSCRRTGSVLDEARE